MENSRQWLASALEKAECKNGTRGEITKDGLLLISPFVAPVPSHQELYGNCSALKRPITDGFMSYYENLFILYVLVFFFLSLLP